MLGSPDSACRNKPWGSTVRRYAALLASLLCLACTALFLDGRLANAAISTPTSVTTSSRSVTALRLTWSAVTGAPRYRVQYATDQAMSDAVYRRSWSNSLDLTTLQAGRTYYVRVRVISADGTKSLTPYSPAVRVSTRSAGDYPHLSPSGLKVENVNSVEAFLRWHGSEAGLSYRVELTQGTAVPRYFRFHAVTYASIKALTAGATYMARVRVISAAGVSLSEYSAKVSFKTPKVAPSPSPSATPSIPTEPTPSNPPGASLRIATYNVKCANCFSGVPDEEPWSVRAPVVARTVLQQAPDVIGLQEASQGWLRDSNGDQINKSQFEDLVERLGPGYRLTNSARNNCVTSSTPTNCVPADQGASQGTKIVYRAARLALVAQGSKKLSSQGSQARYLAWAIFQDRVSGKRFFFADTHLEPSSDSAELRRIQTAEVLSEIRLKNPAGLPAVIAGDLNSHKWTLPANTPYDLILEAGYVDPLGNYYRSTTATRGATVENRVRTNFSSFNAFVRQAKSFTYVNGTYLDYLFTTPMRVLEWETVVEIDSSGRFIGVIPSDHNMLRATVVLP